MTLEEKRLRAAQVTGGISSEPCYAMAWELLRKSGADGRLLEFGAGAGHFATRIASSGAFHTVACADILPRPAGMSESVEWSVLDLNRPVPVCDESFDTIVSVEVIEHLENPRAVFREFHRLLRPKGLLVLTTPNQESIRSFAGLFFGGHFAAFLGKSYPAHITALLRKDLERICAETGFESPEFVFSGDGRIPKITSWRWQNAAPFLKGRYFSDNLGIAVRKK